ncbi:MAG TPA: DUF29 domain-containing protein [Planctomycetota bacterium]|nr:DUF29 domain-containing protein [Planctomycetota bacterium]
MTATEAESLSALYLSDETAWLEAMANAIANEDWSELDCDNLREYLTDMALRDRKEVLSRLIILISHHLKWQFQPIKESKSWRLTIAEQRRALAADFKSKTLRNYAESALAEAYAAAVEQAAIQTGLPESAFPARSKLTAREWMELPVPDAN